MRVMESAQLFPLAAALFVGGLTLGCDSDAGSESTGPASARQDEHGGAPHGAAGASPGSRSPAGGSTGSVGAGVGTGSATGSGVGSTSFNAGVTSLGESAPAASTAPATTAPATGHAEKH